MQPPGCISLVAARGGSPQGRLLVPFQQNYRRANDKQVRHPDYIEPKFRSGVGFAWVRGRTRKCIASQMNIP